jgi:hypothetical protein
MAGYDWHKKQYIAKKQMAVKKTPLANAASEEYQGVTYDTISVDEWKDVPWANVAEFPIYDNSTPLPADWQAAYQNGIWNQHKSEQDYKKLINSIAGAAPAMFGGDTLTWKTGAYGTPPQPPALFDSTTETQYPWFAKVTWEDLQLPTADQSPLVLPNVASIASVTHHKGVTFHILDIKQRWMCNGLKSWPDPLSKTDTQTAMVFFEKFFCKECQPYMKKYEAA